MFSAGKEASPIESEIHPSHKPAVCTPGISLLRRACIECSDCPPHIRYREKCSRIFLLLLRQSSIASAAATATAVANENAGKR